MAERLNQRAVGAYGEALTWQVYAAAGYRLVAQNWHFHRLGEIDLILEKDGVLVFCEVKLRQDLSFSSAAGAVGAAKQRRIRKLARCFLQCHPAFDDYTVRLDVSEVVPDDSGKMSVNLLPNAF